MMFVVRRNIWLFVLIVVCLFAPFVLLAQEPGASDDDVNAIAEQLYCPVCENSTLDVCATAACAQWREEIRFQLDEGWTEEQIIDNFVARFGNRVVEPGASDDDVNAIAEQLYCPVCENIPLDVCATAACAQWREEIRFQLDEGWTEDQIINDFVVRFGDRVVGTPQNPTLRALSLVTPWIMGLLVLAVGVFTFVRWRANRHVRSEFSPAPANPQGNAPLEDDYRNQLEQDLRARS